MSATQSAQLKPLLGKGDHSPVFSCTDIDGDLFDFYVAVTGKPIVLIFCGDRDLKDLAESSLSETFFDQDFPKDSKDFALLRLFLFYCGYIKYVFVVYFF